MPIFKEMQMHCKNERRIVTHDESYIQTVQQRALGWSHGEAMGERGTACLAQNVDEAVCLEGLPCCEAAVAEPQDMWPLQSLQHFEMISNDFYDVSMHFWLQELAILAILFPSFSSLIVKQYFGRCTLIWSMSDRAFQSPSSALPCLCDSALCLYPQIPSPTWLKMIGSLPQQNMNSGPLKDEDEKKSHNPGA